MNIKENIEGIDILERLLQIQYKSFLLVLVICVLGLFRYEIGADYNWYIILFNTVKFDD